MTSIELTDVLLYYDGIQVFEGRDAIGGHYVGVNIGLEITTDRYLVTATVPRRLQEFRSGDLDLKTLLLEAPEGAWYLTTDEGTDDAPLFLEPQPGPISQSPYLPGPKVILSATSPEDATLNLARQSGNTILELIAAPPEAVTHHIRANTLAGILTNVQNAIRYAYREVTTDLENQDNLLFHHQNGYILNVAVPASAGSFRVILESAFPDQKDTTIHLMAAIQRLDDLFKATTEPADTAQFLSGNQGDLTTSFAKLVQFLVENKTGLTYSWASSDSTAAQHGGASHAEAQKIVEAIANHQIRNGREVVISGTIYRVNSKTGSWGITRDQRRITGKVANDGPSLEGFEIGKNYHFYCTEVQEISKRKPSLYMREATPF